MNRNLSQRLAAFTAAALLATGTVAATAQTTAPASAAPVAATATAATMNFQQIVDRVVSQGYSDIREVERESDKLYEVKARDGQGRQVELYVDARSGEILRAKQK